MRFKRLAMLAAVIFAVGGTTWAYAAFNAAPAPEDILTRAVQTLESAQNGHAVVNIDENTPNKSGTATIEIWGKKTSGTGAGAYEVRAEVRQASDPKLQGGVFVSDGKEFWAYSPSQNTVWTGSVNQLNNANSSGGGAASLLSETPQALVQKLFDYSTVSLAGTETFQGSSTFKLQLTPKPGKGPAAAAGATGFVWIDSSRWLPLQATLNGGSMGQGRVTVQSIELNQGVADNLFRFQVPAGAKVVSVNDLIPKHVTLSEAQKTAGFPLLTPTYVPNGATLVDVLKVGHTIALRYEFSGGGLAITEGNGVQKNPGTGQSESVTVRGTTGTFRSNSNGTQGILAWTQNGVTYTVSGVISKADAIKVADSLK